LLIFSNDVKKHFVPKGLALGLVWFNTFISDLVDGAEYTLSKSAMIQSWEQWLIHQAVVLPFRGDISKLGKWADRNLMKLNKWKWQVLPLGRNSPRHLDRLGLTCWEAALQEEALRVLTNTNLTTS